MAQDLDNLAGHVGEVLLKERRFEDPWGWGIAGIVRRIDDPEYKQAELEFLANKPDAQKQRLALAENIFSEHRPDGFRQGKKPSKRESFERMVHQAAAPGEILTDVLDLRQRKPMIARLLCRTESNASPLTFRGDPVVRYKGQEFDLSTPEGRLGFMNHEIWEFKEGDQAKEQTSPMYKRLANGELELDQYGDPIEHVLGGINWGDALAYLLLREAKDLAAFAVKRDGQVLDLSTPISDGSTETGSASPSPLDE